MNFSKSDYFNANLEIIILDNIFIPKQKLNEFRREVFAKIYVSLTKSHHHSLEKTKLKNNYEVIKFKDFQIIENLDEKLTSSNIIYSPSEYSLLDVEAFAKKCKSTHKHAFLDTPNFALQNDISLIQYIIDTTKIGVIANNYYALSLSDKTIIGAGLNVYNSTTASLFNNPVITAESDISTKINFPYMTLRHCPFKCHFNSTCTYCPYTSGYTYKMDNGKTFKLKRKKLTSCTFYLTD